VGVNDTKLRKWLLSISAFLRNQNRGVADAIELWKKNVDKVGDGENEVRKAPNAAEGLSRAPQHARLGWMAGMCGCLS
jgi:hypothetical protein